MEMDRRLRHPDEAPAPLLKPIRPKFDLSSLLSIVHSFSSPQTNSNANTPENLHQQHIDFIKKYNAGKRRSSPSLSQLPTRLAKTKLESQLELLRNQEMTHGGGSAQDIARRVRRSNSSFSDRTFFPFQHNLINKLNQLEAIKQKHFARRSDHQRQPSAAAPAGQSNEPKDFLNNFFNSTSSSTATNPNGNFSSLETNGTTAPSPLSALFSSPNDQSSSALFSTNFSHQRNSSQTFDPSSQFLDQHSQMKNSLFDEFLTPPPSSSTTSFMPVNHSQSLSVHSYMNVSFHTANTNDGHSIPAPSHYHPHPHHPSYPY